MANQRPARSSSRDAAPDVFISYARSTRDEAERIAAALRASGYGVWRDDELPAHRAYEEVIEERLQKAKAVLVIWSAEAARSQWVRSEANRGREGGKLVQLTVDGAPVPMPFDQIHCVDLTGWAGDVGAASWKVVQQSLVDLVGPRRTGRRARAAAPVPVLAVLPFDNLSGDAEMSWFSDGVSEEILQTVAQRSGLKVIGRSSSFQFRGADKGARKIAAELGATHMLDGSVRRSGERVRISAQLIECADQTTVWSDRMDRQMVDIFELQDEIAAAVATALQQKLRPPAVSQRVDPAAYDLYLRARATTDQWLGGADEALLAQAVSLQPDFAAAWASLALTRAIKTQTDASDAEFQEMRSLAVEAAEQALALDPSSGPAYAALSFVEPVCGALVEREALLEKARQASPDDPWVLLHISRFYLSVGRCRDAMRNTLRLRDLDPLWPQGANQHASTLLYCGLKAQGEAAYDRNRARFPTLRYAAVAPLMRAADVEDWERVDRYLEDIARNGPHTPEVQEAVRRAKRRRALTLADMQRYLQRESDKLDREGAVSPMIHAFCRWGLSDQAYDLVERSSWERLYRPGGRLARDEFGLHGLFTENGLEMRADPRFVRLCGKLSLVDYWVGTERWPDCADQVPYDFRGECARWMAETR